MIGWPVTSWPSTSWHTTKKNGRRARTEHNVGEGWRSHNSSTQRHRTHTRKLRQRRRRRAIVRPKQLFYTTTPLPDSTRASRPRGREEGRRKRESEKGEEGNTRDSMTARTTHARRLVDNESWQRSQVGGDSSSLQIRGWDTGARGS